jgi:hypothetical protein
VLDGALQGFTAVREPVEIGNGDAGADDPGGTDLLAEAGDGGVGAGWISGSRPNSSDGPVAA